MVMSKGTPNPDVVIDLLDQAQIRDAARLAAAALNSDPMSIALFGPRPGKRARALTAMFTLTLRNLKQPPLVARLNGELVGIVAAAPVDACLFRQMKQHREIKIAGRSIQYAGPSVQFDLIWPLLRMGLGSLGRMGKLTEGMAPHDPQEPHVHIELVAVAPGHQGKGIGTRLMHHTLEVTAMHHTAYLETTIDRDVHFYERFGFSVTGREDVLGVDFRFMTRPPTES
jgi:ribosomal protein S18 acetylase RimI-like enzyme